MIARLKVWTRNWGVATTGSDGADRKFVTVDAAKAVGALVAQRAIAAGITEVVFDRGGYMFHGRVKALADAAREGGLSF